MTFAPPWSGPPAKEIRTPFKPATYARFYEEPPVEDDVNGQAWYCRGQNMIVNYLLAKAGGRFSRSGQPDEYALLIPEKGCEWSSPPGTKSSRSPGLR